MVRPLRRPLCLALLTPVPLWRGVSWPLSTARQVCKAAGFDGMAFSDKTSGPDCQTLVDAITTIWRTS